MAYFSDLISDNRRRVTERSMGAPNGNSIGMSRLPVLHEPLAGAGVPGTPASEPPPIRVADPSSALDGDSIRSGYDAAGDKGETNGGTPYQGGDRQGATPRDAIAAFPERDSISGADNGNGDTGRKRDQWPDKTGAQAIQPASHHPTSHQFAPFRAHGAPPRENSSTGRLPDPGPISNDKPRFARQNTHIGMVTAAEQAHANDPKSHAPSRSNWTAGGRADGSREIPAVSAAPAGAKQDSACPASPLAPFNSSNGQNLSEASGDAFSAAGIHTGTEPASTDDTTRSKIAAPGKKGHAVARTPTSARKKAGATADRTATASSQAPNDPAALNNAGQLLEGITTTPSRHHGRVAGSGDTANQGRAINGQPGHQRPQQDDYDSITGASILNTDVVHDVKRHLQVEGSPREKGSFKSGQHLSDTPENRFTPQPPGSPLDSSEMAKGNIETTIRNGGDTRLSTTGDGNLTAAAIRNKNLEDTGLTNGLSPSSTSNRPPSSEMRGPAKGQEIAAAPTVETDGYRPHSTASAEGIAPEPRPATISSGAPQRPQVSIGSIDVIVRGGGPQRKTQSASRHNRNTAAAIYLRGI